MAGLELIKNSTFKMSVQMKKCMDNLDVYRYYVCGLKVGVLIIW